MRFCDMEHIILENRIGSAEGDAVDGSEGDAVETVGRPHLLNHSVCVSHTVDIGVAIGDAVHINVEKSVKTAVIAVSI